jgi:putative OPT family oligopeptide transporter
LLLAFVFGAANAYLGMKAGQTVAATIPAAVIALAAFRSRLLHGSVLEQNIARTAASVGEALVAGAIFTIPAFTLARAGDQKLWADLGAHYREASLILLAGGLLGVFFVIALRRPLCVEAGLPWPESVASAEIVRAGERAGAASRRLFGAMGLAAVIELLKSDRGLPLLAESASGFVKFPLAVVRHSDAAQRALAEVRHGGGVLWSTPSLSPALLGIGYIVGPRVAAVNVAGGILAWWVLIPALLFFDPDLLARMGAEQRGRGRRQRTRSGAMWSARWRWARCWWRRCTRCTRCGIPSGVRWPDFGKREERRRLPSNAPSAIWRLAGFSPG